MYGIAQEMSGGAQSRCAQKVTERAMAIKRTKGGDSAYQIYNVLYEDGSRSSNRKVPVAEIDQLEIEASAKAILEAQDRRIAELSGRPQRTIKSIGRVS